MRPESFFLTATAIGCFARSVVHCPWRSISICFMVQPLLVASTKWSLTNP